MWPTPCWKNWYEEDYPFDYFQCWGSARQKETSMWLDKSHHSYMTFTNTHILNSLPLLLSTTES